MLRTQTALNGICPYFTMFPLDFPLGILAKHAGPAEYVLDPFCGRGTTSFAARIMRLESLGVDSSPVAVAITGSKLAITSVDAIVSEARAILSERKARDVPCAEFWCLAYHPVVLDALCRLREAFLEDCSTPARIALRGILLGALHGPKRKTVSSYLSNQCPRTYAPKPGYAMRFWRERGLEPEQVDILDVVERRARRYFGPLPDVIGTVRLADSRQADSLRPVPSDKLFQWVITSPPYYGMRTYIPDQWLRNWFLGGPPVVDYTATSQIAHGSPEEFAADLKKVWRNTAAVSNGDAKLIVRFGGFANRGTDPLELLKSSLADSGWRMMEIREAGTAARGKRQANTFLSKSHDAGAEWDVWAVKEVDC